ncbi:MAG: response regulator [Desulfobacterales bacterium]
MMQTAGVNTNKKGVILFVDDDELVLEVGSKMIQRLDYEVLVARNGQEAIEVFEKNKDTVDAVILDMRMPGMNGATVHDHLRKIKSDAKILLASGYLENRRAQDIIQHRYNDFIQKPFHFEQLTQKIEGIMER